MKKMLLLFFLFVVVFSASGQVSFTIKQGLTLPQTGVCAKTHFNSLRFEYS